jgi:RND family efflux transporter MFP subunit
VNRYRKAFIAAFVVNFILAGVVAGILWNNHRFPAEIQAASPQPNADSQPGPDSSSASPVESPLAPVQLSAERLQSIGVKFGDVARKPVQDELRVTGTVAMDETRLSYVQTRFSGYIQKVFANATYQYVREGQPLFTIYSPELVAAENDYLVARQSAANLSKSTVPGVAAGAATLVSTSSERLNQWNIPQREIARLESTGQVDREMEIDSPVRGYITERNALPNAYVQPETRLYTVADLSTVWVLAQVPQNDLGQVKVNAPATLTIDTFPGRTFRGRVDFIYPDVDMTTRTARVRLSFANSNLTLAPGMFANVILQVPLGRQLVIPASGVLQSGTHQIAFVDRGNGSLEPREIELGPRVNEDYVVMKGLKAGERVVTSANFLVDSESQLQAALGSFVPPPPGAGSAAQTNAPDATVEFTSTPNPPRSGANTFQVKLKDPKGAAISGGMVTVTFFMAAMPDMGMAAMREEFKLTEKGSGTYEGQGKVPSGGTWQVNIVARRDNKVVATKQLSVRIAGGM